VRHVLHRDYETRGKLAIKSVGTHRYAADSDTEVICCAYAVDDESVLYRGTAFLKERINLKTLKLLEKFLAPACSCNALVFLFYRSPVTPLPERRRNTLL
jgi:hypothetical protein